MIRRIFIPLFVIVILLSACKLGKTPAVTATSAPPSTDQPPAAPPAETQPPATVAPPVATQTPTPLPGNPPLLPEPQEVAFQASDGQELKGYYYPAAVNPAPLVVLMHWVGGNLSDWYEIAVWLQNRGQKNPFTNPGSEPWWDPGWFPPVPDGISYGVFIFSFRDCAPYQAGCAHWFPDIWRFDAQAAMDKAAELEGVDKTRIVTGGSSIGADAAPNSCTYLNQQTPGSCKGSISFSPGNYIGDPYPTVVHTLGQGQPPVAAWCLADENEFGMCESAELAGNTAYRDFMINNGQHGQMLLRPGLDPLPMQILLDFLAATVGP